MRNGQRGTMSESEYRLSVEDYSALKLETNESLRSSINADTLWKYKKKDISDQKEPSKIV